MGERLCNVSPSVTDGLRESPGGTATCRAQAPSALFPLSAVIDSPVTRPAAAEGPRSLPAGTSPSLLPPWPLLSTPPVSKGCCKCHLLMPRRRGRPSHLRACHLAPGQCKLQVPRRVVVQCEICHHSLPEHKSPRLKIIDFFK